MSKKFFLIFICISITLGIGFYYYYDTYIDKEKTTVSGFNNKYIVKNNNVTKEITVTNGKNRKLLVQTLNKKKWETVNTYNLNDKEKQTLNITFSNNSNNNITNNRILIEEGPTVYSYVSENIILYNTNRENINLDAKSAIITGLDNDQVYYQKNTNEKRSIASTTKILVCLVALEHKKLDDSITITSEAVTTHLSRLRGVGDKAKLEDIMHMALMSSDNGAAWAIAQGVSGNITNFNKLINKKLEELGCHDSHFTNPAGFTSKKHYSTARDLAIITKEAYKNKTIRKIIKKKHYSFTTLKKKNSYQCNTTNKLLGEIKGVTGMKTGTTYKAGKCFVCTYEHNSKTYAIVVLGSSEKGRWNDTKKLIKYIDKYC